MTNYAIIATGGKQYKVIVGQELLVDKLETPKGKTHIFEQVLLVRQDDKVLIGNPYVAKGTVSGEILDQIKGEKVTTSKFKAKVHYRRKIGFRPLYSKVKIGSISVSGERRVSAPKKIKAKSSVKSA